MISRAEKAHDNLAEPIGVAGSAASALSRDNNFDALRLLFAVCILVSHSYEMIHGGFADVRISGNLYRFDVYTTFGTTSLVGFFAIGGYLICNSYLSSRNVGSYMWKRVLRIEPAFLATAMACILVVGPIGSDSVGAYFRALDPVDQIRAIATLHLSPRTAHVFVHNPSHQLDTPMWTLPVEFAMYLLVAFLGITAMLRRRWPVILCWMALAALHIVVAHTVPHWARIPRFAQGPMELTLQFYLVFVGGVVIRLYPCLQSSMSAAVAAFGWLVGYLCGVGYVTKGIVAPILIVWFGENGFRLPRPRDDLSYGIYLNAWPIQQIIFAYCTLDAPMLSVCALLISVPLAFLSWRFIERPALQRKELSPRRLLEHFRPRVTT